MHLVLDHLTVGDAYPWEIADLAARNGLQGCCLFLESMSVLPRMPTYSLIQDAEARLRTRQALVANGISLDLAYPFTLTGRSQIADFTAGLEAAAFLGAAAVNLLVYDREPERAEANIAAFADAAAPYGLEVVIEFYPPSAISSLSQAHELVSRVGRSNLGINADLLHLYRSGGRIEDVGLYGRHVRFAQLADGPINAPQDLVFEAASNRLALGDGQFAVTDFIRALPDVKISLEVPNDGELMSGLTQQERAARSLSVFKSIIATTQN